MLRGMQKMPSSLSITRQSIQDIWHVACQTEANTLFGLLGVSDSGVICRIHHLDVLNQKEGIKIAKLWAKDGISVQGSFQSKPLSKQSIQDNEKNIQSMGFLKPTGRWVYLLLNTDTQGCLQSTLHYWMNHKIIELPIALVDDGLLPLKG
ncbi:MAG: hypothetical protein Q9M10_00500 [Mariprofundaceae bacterium]|nr:hypothetical protein [Mariprofundaceae bacterium]